ncbi:MAG: hypothetical protein S0880_13655 [Actinomycetota bacterium]|nr:hypothetical protein [Actinomycetota bacterium]
MIGESIRFVVQRALVPSLRDAGYNNIVTTGGGLNTMSCGA